MLFYRKILLQSRTEISGLLKLLRIIWLNIGFGMGNSAENFLGEILGYASLERMVGTTLTGIMELREDIRGAAVLHSLRGTLFGTMRADYDQDNGARYCDVIEIPRIVEIGKLRVADFGSSDEVTEDYDPLRTTEVTSGTLTRESSPFDRLVSDPLLYKSEFSMEGVRGIYGITTAAKFTAGTFDTIFTLPKFLGDRRLEKARKYLAKLLEKNGFQEKSYRMEVLKDTDKEDSDNVSYALVLNLGNLSLVFRAERGIEIESDIKRPSGTAVYFDVDQGYVDRVNRIVGNYYDITRIKKRGRSN